MHTARTGLLLSAALLAALLVALSFWSYQGVHAAGEVLAQGQGALLGRQVQLSLAHGRPDAASLQAAIADLPDVRWIAAVEPTGLIAEVGTRPTGTLPHPEQLFRWEGDVALLFVTPSPPAPGMPPREPALLLAYTPALAQALASRAEQTLAVSVAGAGLLLAAAALFWRQSARTEVAERALAHAEHLASLGQMSAIIAHEIRNPLAALKGHAQLLEEATVGDKAKSRAQRVVNEAERLEQLTNSLLDFTRSAAIERQPVAPVEVLRGALTDLGIEATVDSAAAPAVWSLDPVRVRQVLVNLLDNAHQAGGPIEVTITAEAAALTYTIRDHGPGITPELKDRLFEPFVTGRTRGTGLGLAVAQRVVRLHGGQIHARNHPDGGAIFHVELPER